ncbi:hypothetical protein NEOLEDRAFT_1146774 [Neolentinus lepideus HHB14362 ss-1]|uniref:DNase I-like protein n=1 Tax=Neolentinus lepideus HHB14362 ss-1 TaxID=1314782 RepID=A0A165TW37_9AGAM|nr:hypothetical protein NEOLEDRAFT_1146774 [Neolentinus lepideus HHB14362 ss-1]
MPQLASSCAFWELLNGQVAESLLVYNPYGVKHGLDPPGNSGSDLKQSSPKTNEAEGDDSPHPVFKLSAWLVEELAHQATNTSNIQEITQGPVLWFNGTEGVWGGPMGDGGNSSASYSVEERGARLIGGGASMGVQESGTPFGTPLRAALDDDRILPTPSASQHSDGTMPLHNSGSNYEPAPTVHTPNISMREGTHEPEGHPTHHLQDTHADHPSGDDPRDNEETHSAGNIDPPHPQPHTNQVAQPTEVSGARHHNQPKKPTRRAVIKIASLNIKGFGSQYLQHSDNKWLHVNQLMHEKKITVLLIQEMHIDLERCAAIEELFSLQLQVHTSPDPTNPCGRAGVAIVINKQLVDEDSICSKEIIPGRAILGEMCLKTMHEWRITAVGIPHADHKMVSVELTDEDAPMLGKGHRILHQTMLNDKWFLTGAGKIGLTAQKDLADLGNDRTADANPQWIWHKCKIDILALGFSREKVLIPHLQQQITELEGEIE